SWSATPWRNTGSTPTSRTRPVTEEETPVSVQEVRVPDLGGADEVEVIEISVQPGDSVEVEQGLLVVESDKATVELPSPHQGSVKELKVQVGDKVRQGDLVALLEVGEEAAGQAEAPAEAAKPDMQEKPAAAAAAATPAQEIPKGEDGEREEVV